MSNYEAGLVQRMIGDSAMARQEKIESGQEKIVGVNCYQEKGNTGEAVATSRPDPQQMQRFVKDFKAFRDSRSQQTVERAIDALTRAAHTEDDNVFGRVVEAAAVGVTHGEIIACLRRELGFGQPLIVA